MEVFVEDKIVNKEVCVARVLSKVLVREEYGKEVAEVPIPLL